MSYFATTAITQNVIADSLNSSTTNLSGSGISSSFTGSAVSTLGVVGLQITLKTDQNAVVYVDQSPNSTSWDIIDSYYYYPAANFGITVQAVNSYYRVRVLNTSPIQTATSYFRLQSCLCPVVECVPRSLDQYGNLKTSTQYFGDAYGFHHECTPTNELRAIAPVRLVGAAFSSGTQLDGNFWTTSSYLNTTASQANGAVMLVASGSSASSSLQTNRNARFIIASSMRYRCIIQLSDNGTGSINMCRRWGPYTTSDGAYFELSGSTFNVVTRAAGTDTRISYGSFNGVQQMPTFGNTNEYEIYYIVPNCYFTFQDQLLHTVTITTSPWTTNINLPARAEIIVGSANTTAATTGSLTVRAMTISRMGLLDTQQNYFNTAGGTSTSYVLKYGPGVLKKVIINNPVASTITIYDNTAASGTTIATITSYAAGGANAVEPYIIDYDCAFSTGLTINTSAAINLTITYE